MCEHIKRLFDNYIIIGIGSVWGWIVTFLFPTQSIVAATLAVLITMSLDLLTKIYALSKIHGGFFKAIKTHEIRSNKFAKGTLDKMIVFGVMLIIGGCAYKLMVAEELAIWFVQVVFTIMFLRDVLSIIENLYDAGITGLGLFKHIVRKKFSDYVGEEALDEEIPDKYESDVKKKKREKAKEESDKK